MATTAVDVVVPAHGAVFVGSGSPTVVLTGLTRRLDAAQSVELTLTFARAGRTTVLAIVEPAPGVLPRGPVVDFRVAPHDDALPHAGASGRAG